jgi:hypothetical protein
MKTVNRIAIAVNMREPYLAWARAVAGDDTVIESFTTAYLVDELAVLVPSVMTPACTCVETTAYLVDEPAVLEPDRLIRQHYATILEEQLNSWSRDESSWPASRTVTLFREWFDARVADMVWT